MKYFEEVKNILENNIYNYCISEGALSLVMQNWQTNKQHFIDRFGSDIVQSKEKVSIVRSHDELAIIWNDFISDLGIYRFYKTLIRAEELIAFLTEQGQESFFANKISKAWTCEDGKEIPKGMKISKALKFLVMDKDLLHKIQSKYSMILQDVQLTGYLHISVHPLDFLSVSENSYNWHSCHALDGEYAAGNLNYMTDKVSIVCYLADNKKQEIPRFANIDWNSKKWRSIFFIGEDGKLMLSAKGYPFRSDSLTQQCLDFVQSFYDGEWTKAEPIEDKADAKAMCKDKQQTLHFNDIILSSSFRGYYSHCDLSYNQIEVGEPYYCLSCGNFYAEISDEYTCQDCGSYETCISCGEPLYEGDASYFEGESYCDYCYAEEIVMCACCETEAHNCSDVITWRDDLEAYYCDECYDECIEDWNYEEE